MPNALKKDTATDSSLPLDQRKAMAEAWFRDLRDRICDEFMILEKGLSEGPHIALEPGKFERKTWTRRDEDGSEGGGGEMSIMHGRVFEKVGVNISTVYGRFSENFRAQIPGAGDNDGQFWAAGISLVAHMRSPLVPAVHMNTRMIVTSKEWFGGGSDLNPMIPDASDTAHFHDTFKRCCDRHNPTYYPEYKAWCDRYFFIPHRNEARGVGGIFYDYLNTGDWSADFAFTRDVGESFIAAFTPLVEKHRHDVWTPEQREIQLVKRGRYAEFNLVYDRGTQFGLRTGGNPEAILMSLPPEAKWP